jgi:predicted ester cyclase
MEVAMATDVTALLRHFVHEPWEEGNLEALDEVVADAYVLDDELGLDDLKETIRSTRHGLPDLTVTIDDVVAEGDKVAWRWTMRGTHQGELEGHAATGRPITFSGITIVHLQHGKVVADWFGARGPSVEEQLSSNF